MGVQSGKRGRKNLRMRRTILLSATVGVILAAPQSNLVWTKVTGEYKGEPLKVVRPTTEAALAFMKDFFGEDLCSSAAQAYMESLLSGESGAKASEAAEIAYKAAWRAGARVEPGSPCASAEASFRSSYDSGKDTVTNAALAFAKSWPGLEEGNPCSVSTSTYMESIINGKSTNAAALSAAKAFVGAFADLAKSGNAVVDNSCSKAAKSFIKNSSGPDFAATDAAQSFIDATLSSSSNGYDPVCTDAATIAFLDAKIAKSTDKEASAAAADAYIEANAANKGKRSEACRRAAEAYIKLL